MCSKVFEHTLKCYFTFHYVTFLHSVAIEFSAMGKISQEQLGFTYEKIREKLQLKGRSTAYYVYKNYLKNGNFHDAKRSGRPLKLNDRDRRQLQLCLLRNNKTSIAKLSAIFNSFSDKTVSQMTIRRALYRMGYKGRAAAKQIFLNYQTRRLRATTASDWKKIVFSDECRFGLKVTGEFLCGDKLGSDIYQ